MKPCVSSAFAAIYFSASAIAACGESVLAGVTSLTQPTFQGVATDHSSNGVVRILPVNVSGIASMDGSGSLNNAIREFMLEWDAYVVGVGWDITLQTTASTSWRSDIGVRITTPMDPQAGVTLQPGLDASPGGPTHYASDVLYFRDYGIKDIWTYLPGIVRLEFFETYDDAPDAQDGLWVSGTLNLAWVPYIPTPGSGGLLAIAGCMTLMRRRP